MKKQGRYVGFRALAVCILACGLLHLAASTAVAECTQTDPWPSFRAALPSADRIIVGQVVEDRDPDSDYQLAVFGLRVDGILRGPPPIEPIIEIGHLASGLPRVVCPTGSFVRLVEGDNVVFAFDANGADGSRINTLAYVGRTPDDAIMPGVEEITVAELRDLTRPRDDVGWPGVAVLLIAIVGSTIGLAMWSRWRASPNG